MNLLLFVVTQLLSLFLLLFLLLLQASHIFLSLHSPCYIICVFIIPLFISSVFYIFWNLLQMSPLCFSSFCSCYKLTDSVSSFPIQISHRENLIGPIHRHDNAVGRLHDADQPWSHKSNIMWSGRLDIFPYMGLSYLYFWHRIYHNIYNMLLTCLYSY